MSFDAILHFEQELAKFTGAPYAIMTDCCTHAIELCLRHDRPMAVSFTSTTYLSIPMLMHKLNILYRLVPDEWTGEYQFYGTRIWDCARRLEEGMYRPGDLQCLSFGFGKPLHIGHGGAILLDDYTEYKTMLAQRYDGRDLTISPWESQQTFRVGYHYRPSIEDALMGAALLEGIKLNKPKPIHVAYPDMRGITIID